MTGQDLVSSSLRLIGALASGETAPAPEAEDARVILNQMLDAFAAERLMIPGLARNVFSLTANTQTYTLGTGATFNLARPAKIEKVGIISLNNPAQPLEIPIDYLTDEQYADVPIKNISSSLPQSVWDDCGFPLRILTFIPIPTVTCQTAIYAWTTVGNFADLSTDYTFAPGILEALRYNLAVRLAPEWGATLRPEIASLAVAGKARVKSLNAPTLDLKCDSALSSGRGGYNFYTDNA